MTWQHWCNRSKYRRRCTQQCTSRTPPSCRSPFPWQWTRCWYRTHGTRWSWRTGTSPWPVWQHRRRRWCRWPARRSCTPCSRRCHRRPGRWNTWRHRWWTGQTSRFPSPCTQLPRLTRRWCSCPGCRSDANIEGREELWELTEEVVRSLPCAGKSPLGALCSE